MSEVWGVRVMCVICVICVIYVNNGCSLGVMDV